MSAEFIIPQRKKQKTIKLYDWKTELVMNKNSITRTLNNLIVILSNDPLLHGVLQFNELSQMIEFDGQVPIIRTSSSKAITDNDVANLQVYLSRKYGVEFTKDNLHTAITNISTGNTYHPIKRMIESMPWDRVKRAETIFIDYLGAEDNKYIREVTRTWLTGAVARVYNPGIKQELTVVLQGSQGRGKSTLASKLGGEWFADGLVDMKSKDAKDYIKGTWIVELSELSAMKRTSIEETKQFISAQVDRYRPSHGRLTQEFPRQNVFIATTNDSGYLKDLTGSRRFAPIRIDEIERNKDVFNLTEETVQQIWAEVLTWYKRGQAIYLSKEIEELANKYREQAAEENPMRDLILQYLEVKLPASWDELDTDSKRNHIHSVMNNPRAKTGTIQRNKVTTREILTELFNRSPQDEIRGSSEAKKVSLIMSNLENWKSTTYRVSGLVVKGYMRVDT